MSKFYSAIFSTTLLLLSSCGSMDNAINVEGEKEPVVIEVRDFAEEKALKEKEKLEQEQKRLQEIERKKQEEIAKQEKVVKDIQEVRVKTPYISKNALKKSVKDMNNEDGLVEKQVNELDVDWVSHAVNVIDNLLNTDNTLTKEDLESNLKQLGFIDSEIEQALESY